MLFIQVVRKVLLELTFQKNLEEISAEQQTETS